MNKFVLKVIGITAAAIAVVFAFTLMGIAVFSPSLLSKMYDNVGFRYRSKLYAEKAYEESSSIDDLVLLSNLSIKCKDLEYTEKYCALLLKHEDFEEYLLTIENADVYVDYIASQYVVAVYLRASKAKTEIVNLAMSYSSDYRDANAVENLLLTAYEKKDLTTLNYIKTALSDFEETGNCPSNSVERLTKDIKNIDLLLKSMI